MNSLNLRVSSVKSGENVKKNAELRTTLVSLPKHYETATESYCLDFKVAKTIQEQVNVVKNIFKNLGRDPQALQFLADLYFYCPLKHPVRNQILKLLITAGRLGTGGVDDLCIIAALAQSLEKFVQKVKTEIESSDWNSCITSLSSCFDNFACGLHALEQCLDIVCPFLCASLQKYLTELSVLSSPSVRNEYYLYVHNSLRLSLSCVQEFGIKLQTKHADTLRQLTKLGRQIISDDEMPMDPRTNSGILIANVAKIFGEYGSFIQEVKETKHSNEIALCVGVVNTFDQHDFQVLSTDIRDICSQVEEIANANATIPNILLCATRTLYQYSKIILSLDLKTQSPIDDAKLILRKLLIFTFGYLEHHMDSVRHICRDLLQNVVAAAKKIKFDFLLQKIYDACNSERLSLNMKCVVLQQTAAVLGAEAIISNSPTLFSRLFAEYLGRDFMVNNLFEALMTASHKELPYDAWYKLWIKCLLDITLANDDRLQDIEILVVRAVQCEPQLVEDIIQQTDNNIPIITKMSALWAVRKAGIRLENFNEILLKFSKDLLFSVLSSYDDMRVMALRLLVESHKTSEPLSALECGHVLTYVEYNSNSQSPATRQKTLSLLSKALVRCESNLIRELKQLVHNPVPPGCVSVTHRFLVDFIHVLVINLFKGANFSRRSVSLQLLQQALCISINCNLNLGQMLPKNTVPVLAELLQDSYEANKHCAVRILQQIENKVELSLIDEYNLPIRLDDMRQLLISVRPTDSVTATYQLDFYCNRAQIGVFGEHESPMYRATHFAAMRWLLLQLHAGLKLAKECILQAAKLNPLYGALFAIKHLLKQLDFQLLAQELCWRILVAELIVLCKELTTVVAPIVNSSSPEGHLPNDFSNMSSEYAAQFEIAVPNDPEVGDLNNTRDSKVSLKKCNILSSEHKNQQLDLQQVRTTPQMVLLCAWRTVKEVSLILGDIVLRSPIQFSNLTSQFLITKEQILEVGEHFKQLLAETKHRGAFEQAYVGFSKLCCRLWRVEVLDLNSLPMQWLRELIATISRVDHLNEKMCATRRSAGVPFMAQALVTSELQVGTTKSLHYCMTHLLQLCNSAYSGTVSSVASVSSASSNSERSVESRTHTYNIMRALFRCTDLNEAVGEFVSEGVMCAIRAYDAETWPERNSATLLFAALITRIFGVQRTKDTENLNIRNKMTGRVFFLRYPKLYDFFLEQLSAASSLIKEQRKARKLHPLLLMLSRLYSSALEGTESNFKLSAFIPHIFACEGTPEMKTRYLAAKAVVSLISKNAVVPTILQKCAIIVISHHDRQSIDLNVLHGQLLQILALLKSILSHDESLIDDICATIVTFQHRTQIKNAVILKVMLDIYIELMQRLTNLTVAQDTKQNLLYFSIQKDLQKPQINNYYAVLGKSYFIYNMHVLRLTLPFGALSDYLIKPPVVDKLVPLERAETCLNIILLVLLSCNAFSSGNSKPNTETTAGKCNLNTIDISEFEVLDAELIFVRVLPEDMLFQLCGELRKSKVLQLALKDMLQRPLYYPACAMKAYAILSILNHFDFTLNFLMKEAKKHSADVKTQLTLCVERYITSKRGLDLKIAQTCLEYLREVSLPWQPDSLRWRATKILAHLAPFYPKAFEKKKAEFLRLYIGLILNLLMDEDSDVRNSIAKIILHNLADDIEMDNVVSTMAQRLFLQYTADLLVASRADENFVLDTFQIIVEVMSTTAQPDGNSSGSSAGSHSTANVLEIFDKNEANVFAEPTKTILDAIVVFRATFKGLEKVFKYVTNYKV